MWEAILRWLNPCLHEYETIATLEDRPENPTAATIVQTCKICGRVREQTFRAPVGRGCPPHRWRRIAKEEVFREGYKRPNFIDHILQCELCGDIMKRRT